MITSTQGGSARDSGRPSTGERAPLTAARDPLTCPECGEQEALQGEPRGGTIWVRCERCAHEWPRDPDVCPGCGRRSLADRREPLMQKARGTQQSIVGYRIVEECWSCGYRRE